MAKPSVPPRKSCMVVFGVLQLLLLSKEAALLCPPRCQSCSVFAAKCEQVSALSEVLVGLSSYTEKIHLRHGNLSEIPPLSFTKFSNLQFLSITGFLVSSLTNLTFSTVHANRLRVLNLSNNHLLSCMVQPMAFSGLLLLDELILTNNSLDILRRSWFSEMPILSKLFLGANRIAYLPPRTFESLAKLDELVVSSNLIQYLPMDTFYGLPLLTKLDLSSNKIMFINHEVFQPLQTLKHLLLFQNRLSVLPILPGSVNFLFLHKNPWECNCQLARSMEPLMAKIQYLDDIVCDRPPNFAGHQVMSIRPGDCVSLSPSPSPSTHLLPSAILNLSFFYGFLGGLLVGLIPGLVICCCIPNYCNCTPFAKQTEDKPPSQKKSTKMSLSKKRTSNVDPLKPSSFPIMENAASHSEGVNIARGSLCGCFCGTCRAQDLGQAKSFLKKPVVAFLSTDPVGKTIVTLHEKGDSLSCCLAHRGCINRVNDASRSTRAHGSQEQSFAKWSAGSCCPCIQHATLHQMEWKKHELREGVHHQLDGQISHPETQLGGVQDSEALVHIDFPDESALKMERDCSMFYKTPSKRKELAQNGLNSTTHSWLTTKKKNMSMSGGPSHHYQGGSGTSRRCRKASEEKLYGERFKEGSHSKHPTRSGQSSWKTDIYSKGYSSLPSKGRRKQQRKQPGDLHTPPYCGMTSTSCLSNVPSQSEDYSPRSPKDACTEMLSIAQYPEEGGSNSQYLDTTAQARTRVLEHRKAGIQQQGPDISLSRNVPTTTRMWKHRSDREEPNQYWIAQRRHTQQSTTPRTSRRLDKATQWSSTDKVHLKEHEAALGLHHNAERSKLEDVWQPISLSALHPSCGIPHHGQREGDLETPSPLANTTALATVFPPTKNTMQLILKGQDRSLGVVGTLEAKMVVDHRVDMYPPRGVSLRTLSEEILDAEVPLESFAIGTANPCFAEGKEDGVGSSSKAMDLNSCYDTPIGLLFTTDENPWLLELPTSDKSCSNMIYSSFQGGGHEEAATVTSSCPLVQKMCQINFPLLAEEESTSLPGEHTEADSADMREDCVVAYESPSGNYGEQEGCLKTELDPKSKK
ncbi:reticulon-4 receptor-like 1 [Podarcis lilfordi]|uniref:Reticulon-4 receptor-like 1 n=1 Tax=Podarcis lilfordi TaxID=74358 RepID=A0AA35LEW2_9SAUR|nr:reticulon-4 receptor-like 1 [Podarcis lilfordi]